MKPIVVMLVLLLLHPIASADGHLTDEQVRQILINESIRSFPGNCPCPYSLEIKKSCLGKKCKARPCGGKSAWSNTPIGYPGPICFRADVSDEMVQYFLQKMHR